MAAAIPGRHLVFEPRHSLDTKSLQSSCSWEGGECSARPHNITSHLPADCSYTQLFYSASSTCIGGELRGGSLYGAVFTRWRRHVDFGLCPCVSANVKCGGKKNATWGGLDSLACCTTISAAGFTIPLQFVFRCPKKEEQGSLGVIGDIRLGIFQDELV